MTSGGLRLFATTLVGVALYGCNLSSDGRGVGGNGGSGFGGSGIGGSGTGGGFAGAGGFFFDAGTAGGGGFGGMVGSCPLQQCRPLSSPTIPMGFLMPCCTGDGLCGLAGPFLDSCLPRDAIGRDDPTCPASSVIGMPLSGCCTLNGACGLNLDQADLGCVERKQLAGSGLFDLGGSPVDIRCFSGLVDAGADDAGADDAGDPLCDWLPQGFCDPIALCHSENGTPVCECPPGYADFSAQGERGRLCRDVNECLLGASVCDGGMCVNTTGSFTCE